MKRRVKAVVGRLLCEAGLHRSALRNTATIVAFHRVDDALAGDDLTVSCRDFERFCRFFKRHYEVLSLKELTARLESREGVGGTLAITFDDGYRDNFINAAPILKGLDLPATFFITSRFMGTDHVAWWDAEEGAAPPWMSWDEVRLLADQGFEIGGHTRHHADLGEISGDAAWKEIRGCREDLERMLERPVETFAYPYGRRDALTEDNRDLVRRAGFNVCVSCYGGLNRPGANPLRLLRTPINHWFGSPGQFAFENCLEAAQDESPEDAVENWSPLEK